MKTRTVRTGLAGLFITLGSMIPNKSVLGKIISIEPRNTICCTEPINYSSPVEVSHPNSNNFFSALATKNIRDLTSEERAKINSRVSIRESSGRANAVSRVIRNRIANGRTIVDTTYSLGENQINIGSHGALADYNQTNRRQFREDDMLNPRKNRMVRDWYFRRISHILNSHGIEATVANVLASYNAGPGRFMAAGGDAIRDFKKLPKITQDYIQNITREQN
ncbi:MAG: hypothetical protein NTW17_02675 [Candidatus Pacearchaeota archaeon]|nr:hypothetical protein [Candidatus Pacearchaeota archaeon]